jgi:hypothetical protein
MVLALLALLVLLVSLVFYSSLARNVYVSFFRLGVSGLRGPRELHLLDSIEAIEPPIAVVLLAKCATTTINR